MNIETLRELERSSNIRVSATAALALNTNISYEEAEKRMRAMINECRNPTALQMQYESKFVIRS